MQIWFSSSKNLLLRTNSSVQFDCSVVSNSLQPHGLWDSRLPWPSPTPGAYSSSHPLSRWWHTYSYHIFCHPLLLLPSVFPSLRVFSKSWLFMSGGQSIRASASVSVLSLNIHDWFPLRVTGLISLQSKGLSSVSSNTKVQKTPILQCSAFFIVQLSHPYMTTGKTIALTRLNFVSKATSLFFNMSCHSFSSKSKHFLKFHGCSHHLQWFWTLQK